MTLRVLNDKYAVLVFLRLPASFITVVYLKQLFATFNTIVIIYKNRLEGRMCAAVRKLKRTNVWEAEEIGDTDGEPEFVTTHISCLQIHVFINIQTSSV